MDDESTAKRTSPLMRWGIVVAFAVVALLASYRYAIAASTPPTAPRAAGPASEVATSAPCGTCGESTPSGQGTTRAAKVDKGVQRITVDTSAGYYDPDTVVLKAGHPAEITFTRSSGCLSLVCSEELGFAEDLTAGAKTVKLGPLKAGTYSFSCGMQMQFGSIVVK